MGDELGVVEVFVCGLELYVLDVEVIWFVLFGGGELDGSVLDDG